MKFTTIISSIIGIFLTGLGFGYTLTIEPSLATNQIEDINFNLTTFGDDFDAGENAFVDTAAIMMNCDLIITTDTVTAHLAGALGCPTWVALKKVPDWRWMLEQNHSPWYPSMKLYRQKELGDWDHVFEIINILNVLI